MNLTNSATPAASSSACCSPVCTSAVSGRCGAIALTSACSGTPSAACTAITSKPSLPSIDWAVSTSQIASVAPPIESTPPTLAMPVSVNERVGPLAPTRTVSPTAKSWPDAVALSITTSFGPDAHAPSTSSNGLNRSSVGLRPRPNVGLSPVIASPSLSRILAWLASPVRSRIVPVA